MQTDLLEEITALVDGEIADKARSHELSNLINNDENLSFEKHVQISVKSLCKNRFAKQKAPEFLISSIKNKLLSQT